MKKTILLVDIDSKIPNLALKKIELFYKQQDYEVIYNSPLDRFIADKIYVSCVFDWNKNKCIEYEGEAEIGGSGYDLFKKLPPEIEEIKPHINYGFTTRGCIRHCKFCIVPEMEGKIRIIGDLYDLWDGKSKEVIVMDNNILALPEHFKLICKQAKNSKIRVDFNQGLDHRLLNDELVELLSETPHIKYKFAFDNINSKPTVEKALTLLRKYKLNCNTWYTLVGFDSTLEQDFQRLNYLRGWGETPYLQRYKTIMKDRRYMLMSNWVNGRCTFMAMTFKEYINQPKYQKYIPLYKDINIDATIS